ncbi:fungal-specific transcription factor domain-containing protein [Fusarium solani]|uniref:Fungal-specific transcription factor domain-containing protein n=1 Tax=Fusarium solani TaxID=169388 RepID=A0A9P9G420_FUSSL|nr:fungal-specific transcription factor domain-containing protein [Fusarium solani]KAH7232041.1 fungal-specific transcription factor domain-containing protein [Fusarium solani]
MASPRKIDCCWTCKLRHVKCDGGETACLQCTSRHIDCHGYGQKPAWMDGGLEEEQERQRIKRAVMKNFKQKKKRRLAKNQGHAQPRVQSPHASTLEVTCQDTTSSLDRRPWQSRILSSCSFPKPLQYDEASLLMHYLDHVFPYQYPFCEKGEWSRGWLLWLLSKNGPLYRASLGLAALHRRALLGDTEAHHLELEFHTNALSQLQDFIVSFNTDELRPDDENLVEIIACGVALISFELKVLRGSTNNWQPHLCAMASIATAIHDRPQLPQSPNRVLPLLFENKATAAISFHIPVLLWMDILACIATQQKPKLPYEEWLGPSCSFDLSIGDLGALNEWTVEAFNSNQLEVEQLRRRKQHIEDDLEDCMEAVPITSAEARMRSGQGCVTRIFAAAALVQLQLVGQRILPRLSSTRIRRAVSRTILEIQMAQGTISPRQISWPICVAGCVADPDQRLFFEQLLEETLSQGGGMIGNCGTILDIIQNSWRYQGDQPDVQWDCGSVMKEMGICALLI